MRVLVACEFSGVVRDAFAKKGHYAVSCDYLPSERPDGMHHQGNVMDIIDDRWDLMIAHPPCTYLANSDVQWLTNQRLSDRDRDGRSMGVRGRLSVSSRGLQRNLGTCQG